MASSYSNEEMEEILKRALGAEDAQGISHADMLDAARQVGIDPEAVEAAAVELAHEKALQTRTSAVLLEHRHGFWPALGNFLAINGLVFGINMLVGGPLWFYWVSLGTGLMLARRGLKTLWPSERDLRRAEKRLDKREDRRLRRENRAEYERRKKLRQKQTAEHFERAVEEGVGAVLKLAADQLEKYNSGEQQQPRVRVAEPLAQAAQDRAGEDEDEPGREPQHRHKP